MKPFLALFLCLAAAQAAPPSPQAQTRSPHQDDRGAAPRPSAPAAAPARAHVVSPPPVVVYSEAQKSAAMRVDLARSRTEWLADHCRSGEQRDEFRFSLLIWQVDNLDVSLASDRVLASMTAAQRQALQQQLDTAKKPDALPNAALCDLLSRRMREGRLDYIRTDADAAVILRAIHATDTKMRIVKRNADLQVGCVKQQYNAGLRDFARVDGYCECQTEAITANADDAQIDAWLAGLTGTSSIAGTADGKALANTLQQDWVARALKAARRCPGAPR